MQDQLKDFLDQIHSIEPGYSNMFGGVPGMAGSSITITGAANSTTDIVNKLRRDSIEFARLVHQKAQKQDITDAADVVEGDINILAAMGALSEKSGSVLTDRLHNLVEPPSSPFALDI